MKHFLLLIFALLATPIWAQQDAQFTQFMFNKQYYNPAYSGIRGVPTIGAFYRKQWLGFTGAPENQQLAFNMPAFGDRVGLGVLLNRKSIGITQNIGATLSYSYSLAKTDNVALKIGLQGSFEQFSINFDDPSNVIREPGDPSTRSDQAQVSSGNVGVGLFFSQTNGYFGVSMPQVLESTIGVNDAGTLTATRARHLYAMAGAAIPIGDKFRLLPAGLVKLVRNTPLSYDVNLGLEFFRILTIGASYRSDETGGADSIDFLAHFLIMNRMGIGVSYDNPLSPMKDFSKGSIEVLLQYDLKTKDNLSSGSGTDMSNPRFFF